MARISELHYSNNYAASSGVAEFVEVALEPGESPDDYTIQFYEADGSPGITVNLADVPPGRVTVDPETGETVYVISSEDFDFLITDPNSGANNNYEGIALVDVSDPTDPSTVNFYDIGGGTQGIVANGGLAGGDTSTNIPVPRGPDTINASIQFNEPDETTVTFGDVGPGDSGLCFCRGTLIRTPDGDRPVEDLEPGDLVLTVDHGPQPVRWHGTSTARAEGNMAPIRFAAGAHDATAPLMVSPQHRMLVSGPSIELHFGISEGLVAAKHLVNGDTVTRAPGGSVEYHHIMFDRHELIWANGAVTESFFVAENGLGIMDPEMRAEFAALFPELVGDAAVFGGLCRTALTGREAALVA
ncbi:Hint domain-containing protein [Aestuariibius sp. 2305UL40-4]|uniref:Hint domain-containing protein n=1 Tax=Aestuariibius violaceus TaxID=3234132 RepID=UPI00345F0C7A